jgi:16S rRNA (guanine527-N7)-methyltransferase
MHEMGFSLLTLSQCFEDIISPNRYNLISMKELAENALTLLGLRITDAQRSAFETFEQELVEWNARYNLTAIDDPKKIRTKHFLDSLTCLLAMRDTPTDRVIDIGTGAGFPGIPLGIMCLSMKITLVESVGKKADFCRHIVEILELPNVEVLNRRAEEVGADPEHRGQYTWAIARAVAALPTLVEYLLPLVRMGGNTLAMKGESGPAEAHTAEHAIHLLGGQLHQLIPISLPGVEEQRYLVVMNKIAATPERYPRRVGIPAKRPLSNG